MEKISIIIPTINRNQSLLVLLNSVFENTVLPNEIIIVEQGDFEETKNFIQKNFKDKNDLIKLIFQSEKSLAVARNTGVKESGGDVLIFLDDDVEIGRDYIEVVSKYLQNNPGIIGLTGSYYKNSPAFNFKKLLGIFFGVYSFACQNTVLSSGCYDYIRGKNLRSDQNVQWLFGCNMVCRKFIFESGARFNDDFKKWSFGEDVMFSYSIYKKFPGSLKYLPDLVVTHHEGKAEKITNKQALKMQVIYRYIFWAKEVNVDKSFAATLMYLWSQIGMMGLEFFKSKDLSNIKTIILSWIYLFQNRLGILDNSVNYNSYIFSDKDFELWRTNIFGKFVFVRLKQFIDNPKYFIYYLKRLFIYKNTADRYISKYDNFTFLGASETLDYIIDNRVSIARFSDGEIGILTGAGIYPPDSDWSQKYSDKLKKRLEEVLKTNDKNLILAHEAPDIFLRSKSRSPQSGYIYNMWVDTKVILYKYLVPGVTYGHAHLFIPEHNKNLNWSKVKKFLSDKDVVVVTGGVDKISDIQLGKRTYFLEVGKDNVFEKYDQVYESLMSLIKDKMLDKNNLLIMLSLGPTANILALDLSRQGYLAWDTGHIFRFCYKELKKLYE